MELEQWGSYVIAGCSVLGLWLLGRKQAWVWMFMASGQFLWVVYGYFTEQYGFLLSGIAYLSINIRNWRKWKKDEHNTMEAEGRGREIPGRSSDQRMGEPGHR